MNTYVPTMVFIFIYSSTNFTRAEFNRALNSIERWENRLYKFRNR